MLTQPHSLGPLTREDLVASPALLNSELPGFLPHVILKAEEDGLCAHILHDAHDGSALVFLTGCRLPVGLACMWPSRFEVVDFLARADVFEYVDLTGGERAGLVRCDFSVEEWMNVRPDYVDDAAERRALFLPDVEGFSRRAWSAVACGLELGFAVRNEARQRANVADLIEEGFVADDNKFNHLPLAPRDDIGHLWASGINPLGINEHAED